MLSVGRFVCLHCNNATSVIETRLSSFRIRRRRSCPGGHRFNTIEVPVEIQDKLHDLIKWIEGQLDDESADYVHSQLDCILLGTTPEGEEDHPPPS